MLRTLGKPPLACESPATNRKLCGMNCGLAGWTGSRRAALGPDSRQLVADQRQKHDRAPGERRFGGDLARAEPGPQRAEHDLEQPEQRDFRREQRAARDHHQHARQPELEEAEEREQREVARRGAERKRERQGNRARHRATQHERWNEVEAAGGGAQRHHVDRRGERDGERDEHAAQVARVLPENPAPNIHAMPAPAAAAASQVRIRTGSLKTRRASSTVRSGLTLITTSVLAVVVRESASTNAVNITPHSAPDKRPGQPAPRAARQGFLFITMTSVAATNALAKKLRQNTCSKGVARSMCRVTTPAVLQSTGAATISAR